MMFDRPYPQYHEFDCIHKYFHSKAQMRFSLNDFFILQHSKFLAQHSIFPRLVESFEQTSEVLLHHSPQHRRLL